MENERKEWSIGEQLKRTLLWETKKLYHKLYIPGILLLCVVAVIALLPREVCGYLRIHAMAVVAFVNICLALGLGFSLCFLPAAIHASPYGDALYPLEKTGDLSEKAFLAARVMICLAVTAVVIFAGIFASGLMEKFATESIGWFHLNFIYFDPKNSKWLIFTAGFWKQLIFTGLVQPIVFLWIFLRRLHRHQERQYVRSYILSMFLGELLRAAAELQIVHFAPGHELPAWISTGVWFLVMLGSAYVLFRQSLTDVTSETGQQ